MFVHAVTSMLSYPAPLWQIYFRLAGNLSTSSWSNSPVIWTCHQPLPLPSPYMLRRAGWCSATYLRRFITSVQCDNVVIAPTFEFLNEICARFRACEFLLVGELAGGKFLGGTELCTFNVAKLENSDHSFWAWVRSPIRRRDCLDMMRD